MCGTMFGPPGSFPSIDVTHLLGISSALLHKLLPVHLNDVVYRLLAGLCGLMMIVGVALGPCLGFLQEGLRGGRQ